MENNTIREIEIHSYTRETVDKSKKYEVYSGKLKDGSWIPVRFTQDCGNPRSKGDFILKFVGNLGIIKKTGAKCIWVNKIVEETEKSFNDGLDDLL